MSSRKWPAAVGGTPFGLVSRGRGSYLFQSLFWLGALLLLCTPVLRAQTDQGRHWLEQAEREYSSGSFEKAEFSLRMAISLEPGLLEKNARALRLRGLVDLAAGKTLTGYGFLAASVELQPDPRLHYLLGRHFLELRDFQRSAEQYALAASSHTALGLRSLESPAYTHLAFLPLACPAAQGQAWLSAQLKNEFNDFQRLPLLAEKALTIEELITAAYLGYSLHRLQSGLAGPAGQIKPEVSPGESARLREIQARLNTLLKGVNERQFAFPGSLHYIRGHETAAAHDACLNRIEKLTEQQRQLLARGNTDPSLQHLNFLNEKTKLLYWLRIAHEPSLSSYYTFSSYMQRTGNHREALHLARKALLLQGSAAQLDHASLTHLAGSYRQLEAVYRETGQASQSRSAGLFAAALEEAQSTAAASDAFSADSAGMLTLRKKMREIARENYDWREGLIFLLATEPEALRKRYQELLAKRDAKFMESELMAAFRFLY